jgi:hypothetical protein
MRLAILAASVALVSQASAAPLERERAPSRQASPCPRGFAALQSSDTCVRISGHVRAETLIGSPRNRSSDAFGTRTGGRVQLDIRKQTEYGPLRAVIRGEGLR